MEILLRLRGRFFKSKNKDFQEPLIEFPWVFEVLTKTTEPNCRSVQISSLQLEKQNFSCLNKQPSYVNVLKEDEKFKQQELKSLVEHPWNIGNLAKTFQIWWYLD